ncbi:MAG TPA: helix-turn-helix domain-containing protein [Caulobacteraceae bacterium]|jgi:chromosomal replication initiation ATPase DnaA
MMAESGETGWERRGRRTTQDRARAAFVTHLVALATGVPAQEILCDLRGRDKVAEARAMAMYLLHVGFALPQNRVAAAFQRDRTTISHACSKIEKLRERRDVDRTLSQLEACVQQAPTAVRA